MKLSIVIPVYNEKDTLQEILRRIGEVALPLSREIIVVDDASSDGTRDVLENQLKNQVDRVVVHDRNKGKGAALRSGFKEASGDIVLIQDADLEYDPSEYPRLLKPILDGRAAVVYGSRFSGGGEHRVLYFWHMIGNNLLTLLSNMFTNLNLTDMECCYKIFKKDILQKFEIEENRFGVEPEITAKIAKLGCPIYEIGITYFGRTYKEGKKINWRDGFRALWCIVKYNLCGSVKK